MSVQPQQHAQTVGGIDVIFHHQDTQRLSRKLARLQYVARSEAVTPLMFEYTLLDRAREAGKHIVLPEGTDERVLRAAETLLRRRVVELTLLGPEAEVRFRAARG